MPHFHKIDPVETFGYVVIVLPGDQAVIKVKADCGHLGVAGTNIGKNCGRILGIFAVHLYGWIRNVI